MEDPLQWSEVAKVNKLANPNRIYPGQKLIIPVRLLQGVPLNAEVTFIKGGVLEQPKGSEEWIQLNLRDRDEVRNDEIKAERLTPEEIVALERADEARFSALRKSCDKLINEEFTHIGCDHLFHCGVGNGSCNVSYDGKFRLCSSLWAPETMYDLRRGSLREAWEQLVPKVRDMRSQRREFLERCRRCPIVNLCLWCPAHSYLEMGELDRPIDYFCQVARARAAAIREI